MTRHSTDSNDPRGPRPLTRRTVLVDGARLSLLLPLLPELALGSAQREDAAGAPVLVVVQLSGGNDGLNTVVPWRQDEYRKQRRLIGLPAQDLHRFDDDFGLHPSLPGLSGLAADGLMALVHGVGTPRPDRSHFRSLEIWHTSEPDKPVGSVGWLGNLADQLARKHPGSLPALAVGGRELVLSMRGAEVLPATLPDDRGFTLSRVSQRLAEHRDFILGHPKHDGAPKSDLEFLRQAARTSYSAAERMQKIVATKSPVVYPDRPLARDLRLVARLIAGGFGTRIFHASLGGFDTHASQASVHAALLSDLDGALTAFQRDLVASGVADQVITLVFSEFGRRVRENGSRGTDHGHGGPVFVLGPQVAPGGHGAHPDLAHPVDGDIPSTTDFRGVYRRLERDWMGLEPFARAEIDAPPFLR
ncbi:MAG: DUF1501 domain-containing protein [Planctomycetota bacterium]